LATRYIKEAAERLKAMPKDSDRELTVLEKLLARDPNPKTATVMALDAIFAGIDTVRTSGQHSHVPGSSSGTNTD
jgi:hypothetical protein